MNKETSFELHDIDDVKATLTITATVGEWKRFLAQCAAHGDQTFQWNQSWVGNCYLVEFKQAIDSLLQEAEDHYTQYSETNVKDLREFRVALDQVRPIASAKEYGEKHGL